MVRKSFATLLKSSGVAFLLLVLLFAGGSWQLSAGVIGSALREIAAVLWDAETQWMVFLCLAIYFVAFLLQRSRAENNLTQRRKGARIGAHGLASPTFWLAYALFISAVFYAIDYAPSTPSTQALTLLGGAVLGQGAGLLKSRFSGARSQEPGVRSRGGKQNGFVAFVLVIFILLLSLASVWQPETGHSFAYRSHARWAGPWDNPNTFGILMGVGAALAAGLGLRGWRMEDGGWATEVRSRNSEVGRYVVIGLCLVAVGLMGRGLLHSYSRGAWVATAGGLGYFVFHAVRQKRKAESEKAETRGGNAEGGNRESGNALSTALSHPMGEGVCREPSTLNFQLSTILSISVILISVLVLTFWHFRQTEWHPARRALSVVNTVDFSWRNRVAAWEGDLQIMAERPWFGAGWNQPERLYEHYYLSPKLTESAAIQMNDYLMIGATLGIPGLFCFGMYVGLALTGKAESEKAGKRETRIETADDADDADKQMSGCETQTQLPDAAHGPRLASMESKQSAVSVSSFGSSPGTSQSLLTSSPTGTGGTRCPTLPRPSSDFLAATCRAGAIVLLIGFWFDGGLFKLPTAATFWILLELGSVWNHEIQE